MPRRHTDDDIYTGHRRWLGPRHYTLPFSIPYAAMLPGAAGFVLALVVLDAAGAGGVWRWAVAGAMAFLAGKLAVRFSGTERPVAALPAIFLHETGAPRPDHPRRQQALLRPAAIPVRPVRPARRGRDRSRLS